MRLLQSIFMSLAVGLIGGGVLAAAEEFSQQPIVLHIQIEDEAITPVTVRYFERALDEARSAGAQCLVVELDTPGGLLKSTQQMVTGILSSEVPVVVYVSPSGGRAASAGLFITLSGHVAAMAPGTRIGAAHPVEIGGLPISPPQTPLEPPDDSENDEQPVRPSAMEEKLVNDTVAWARSLAMLRGRNAEWAALAVSESRVMVADEALENGVVDMVAADIAELLRDADGREITVRTATGEETTVRLRTADASIRTLDMWWGEQLLAVISNPNIALLLLVFGFYGILFELYSPGWGVAGTLGVVALVLGFFGLSVLPINYAGLALVAVALAMFVAEAFVTSFGALTVGGIICLILGGTMLVDSPTGFVHVSLEVLIPIAVATGLITAFLVGSVVKTHRGRVRTGEEGLLGMPAVVQEKFVAAAGDYRGPVLVHGEYWQARSPSPVEVGQTVYVKTRQGMTLLVEQHNCSEASTQPDRRAARPKALT